MKSTVPGVFENAFNGASENNAGRPKNPAFPDDFFYQLAQNARDIIFHAQLLPEIKIDYASPSCFPITGYTPEEYYANPMLLMACTHPDDSHLLPDARKEGFKPPTEPLEIRRIRKDGTIIWTEHVITYTRNKEGRIAACQIICRDITRRKKTEEALEENRIFTNSLLENATHATVVLNPDTSVRYVNPAWEKLNGWTLAEIAGVKAPYPWWPEKEKEEWLKNFLESLKQPSGKGELPSIKRNGEEYWIDISWTAVSRNGNVDYFLVNSTDITERKKAEAASKESERKFSKVFNSSPNAICLMSVKERKFIEANDSFFHFTGYSKEDIIGHNHIDLNLCEKKEDQDYIYKCLHETGQVFNKKISCRTKSGEFRDGLFSADVIEIGGEKQFMIVITDISEQVKAEMALRESEEKFSKAFTSSPTAIAIFNLAVSKYLDVNNSFLKFTGYTREELIGHSPEELRLWVNEEEKQNINIKMLDAGGVFNERLHSRRKSGEIRTGLYSAQFIDINNRKHVLLSITDITEQVKAEEALRESEEKFSLAFNASPQMAALSDVENGKYTEVNDSFVNATGYSREELIGHAVGEINMLADEEEFKRMVHVRSEKGSLKNDEFNFRTKSGEIRTWLCSSDRVSIGGRQQVLATATDITERKKMEEALRESEELFSRAFNASPISLSISRISDRKFLQVNDSFLRDKGYTREEVIGKTPSDLNIWGSQGGQSNVIETLYAGGRAHNFQQEYYTKSGERRVGLVSAELIKIGNESCVLVLNNDITQQKQTEEQLRQLSSVTQQVTDSTIITDTKLEITYVNQAAVDMFGYSFEEVKGKKIDFFNEEPPTEQMKRDSEAAINAGKVYSRTMAKRRKDGRIIVCDCRLSPMYDENGKLCSLIDVQRDITKQKEIEDKLQEHKKLIDSILATMPEGVLVIDRQDKIILANKAVYNILHLSSKVVKNKPLSEVLPLDQYFNIHRAVASKSKENNTLEFRCNIQDAEKIIYCVIVKMDGERTLITFSDISREREEEEKLYLTDRLASIGEMAAGLAHELNNPLTGILTLSQILAGSDIPDEHKEDIECIYTEAKRAAGIVKNVLLFARNRADETGCSNVNEVVKDVLRLREYEQRSSNIKVVTKLENTLPGALIDKGQLQQVFLNMISNAEYAIKEAGRPGILTVTTEKANNHINIHFTDNGCGIKKHVMPRIFDPFFTTKEVGKGTGLGLSICYSIIVKHGGKISVKSQVGEGTTFTIRLPVVP